MCIANSKRVFIENLKKARDYYFKMTFSSFIIINHMYVYCELERIFIKNVICGCPEKGKWFIILKWLLPSSFYNKCLKCPPFIVMQALMRFNKFSPICSMSGDATPPREDRINTEHWSIRESIIARLLEKKNLSIIRRIFWEE